ncbi:ER membrane protein complex subunit 7-like protein isoform X2 [Iris pallida]|uniref:ER membrane protein complex subunit 7-like protein isoform X2 n=1 Tax=Iris pallida TaxID=29817 RepID=A0AAX6EV99_IRIPA|nr:ER membrane protein complex subunit 7-like protein isoform X2 [Iris pallida]
MEEKYYEASKGAIFYNVSREKSNGADDGLHADCDVRHAKNGGEYGSRRNKASPRRDEESRRPCWFADWRRRWHCKEQLSHRISCVESQLQN